jgi:hypothetical protein
LDKEDRRRGTQANDWPRRRRKSLYQGSKGGEGMTNKIAIITGGSRGLDRNTAINLARRGVNRWVNAQRIEVSGGLAL